MNNSVEKSYNLHEVGNLIVVICGSIGSLALIMFKSRCSNCCWGMIRREVLPIEANNTISA